MTLTFVASDKVSCLKTKMTDTYSFINHMRLNSNSAEFEEKVASAKISGESLSFRLWLTDSVHREPGLAGRNSRRTHAGHGVRRR